jgi:tetratricopeptide (TPR) repeat protein
VRRANLVAADAAMSKGDAALAVRHYAELLRMNSDNIVAQSGIGLAYLELHRYREAVDAFERAIARVPRGERSGLYNSAAYAYVALGDDVRAEAILAKAYGPESAKRQLAEIREAVRSR